MQVLAALFGTMAAALGVVAAWLTMQTQLRDVRSNVETLESDVATLEGVDDERVSSLEARIEALEAGLGPTSTSSSATTIQRENEREVFRATGDNPVEIGRNSHIDLDTLATDWGVGLGDIGGDLSYSRLGYVDARSLAIVDQGPSYDDCIAQTVFRPSLPPEEVVPGVHMCVETSGGRRAYVRIADVDDELGTITFDIIVWKLGDE